MEKSQEQTEKDGELGVYSLYNGEQPQVVSHAG